ncbi:MAG: histidine kinase [Bacteroides sp.]|nr:histidine kinase [Bacteroides sp.]
MRNDYFRKLKIDTVMLTEQFNNNNFLYNLLTKPGLRWARYLLLVLLVTAISFYQVIVIFQEHLQTLGNKLYIIIFLVFVSYLFLMLFNLYYLLPKFFLRKQYTTYFISLSCLIIILIFGQTFLEYISYSIWEIPSRKYPFIDFATVMDMVSSCFVVVMCILGSSMTVLFKNWISENEQIGQLESTQIESEMELLKEQINPGLLFSILNRAGILASKEPEKASNMLLKLSQLLRYQLYDCNWEQVLLSSEITFLTNYLSLEQLYADGAFEFRITSEGAINSTLVPPLLFIPFAQQAVKERDAYKDCSLIGMHFKSENQLLEFTCNCCSSTTLNNPEYDRIKQRLELMYKDHYTLSAVPDNRFSHKIQLKINLKKQ